MSHTCKPGHPGILADGCERCAEHAATPMLLGLDQPKMEALWDKMIQVERHDIGRYETGAEGEAGRRLYLVAVWLERYVGIDPWRPLSQLRSGVLQLR